MYTPLDIENKKFAKQMVNGYNVEEVDVSTAGGANWNFAPGLSCEMPAAAEQ